MYAIRVALWESNELSGARPTINYLKEIGKSNLDLILEFSIWVLKAEPMEALEVRSFGHDFQRVLMLLPDFHCGSQVRRNIAARACIDAFEERLSRTNYSIFGVHH